MKVTTRVVTRHRGDGRAIYQEIEVESTQILRQNIRNELQGTRMLVSVPRRIGKLQQFAAMYGMSHMRGVRTNWNTVSPRHHTNGPFRVVLDPKNKWIKRSKRHGGMKEPGHKVINKQGLRVHRGTKESCDHVCDELNVQVAKHLMLGTSDTLYTDLEMRILNNEPYASLMRRFGKLNP